MENISNSLIKSIRISALAVLILCISWIITMAISKSGIKPEWTRIDYVQWVSKPGISFIITYINATLLTCVNVFLFYFLYSYVNLNNKILAQLGLLFIPIYGLLNIVCYSIQISAVPSVAKIAIETGNSDFAFQLIQAVPSTFVGYLNGLAYLILGIPSILFGYQFIIDKIKYSGIFLILSSLLSLLGIIGYFCHFKILSNCIVYGGVAFTIALIFMVMEFKNSNK